MTGTILATSILVLLLFAVMMRILSFIPFFVPLVVVSAAATTPIGLDGPPRAPVGAPGLTRVNVTGEEEREGEMHRRVIYSCHYDVQVRLDTIPLVSLDGLVQGLPCLDESPAMHAVGDKYSGTEKLALVDRDSREPNSHVLQCTHSGGIVDRYYFTPKRESHLGKAMSSPSKAGGELKTLIQSMCLSLRAFKVRVPGLIRAATRGDAERAEDINKAVAAFGPRAEGLRIVQSTSAQVEEGPDYTEVSDKASGCALRIYHKGDGGRFSLFVNAALKRSFGGACLIPQPDGASVYPHVAKLRVDRANPTVGKLTCQTNRPSRLLGLYSFELSSIKAFEDVRAPVVGNEIKLEEGDAKTAAAKSMCASIAVMRAHVQDLFAQPGGVIR